MQKNDVITLYAEDCTAEGSAVCRYEGLVVFVPGGLKGELLSVKILKVKRNCAYGKIEQILESSPNRITPACPVALKCGGCIFGHLDYNAELAQKHQIVADAFSHIAKLSVPVKDILSGADSRYRNKAQYPVDINGNVGFFARHSHRIVPCEDCRLQPQIFTNALQIVKQWMRQNNIAGYDEANNKGVIRHIYLRYAEATNQLMVTLVINTKTLPASNSLIEALRTKLPDSFCTLVINVNQKDTNVILSDKCKTLYGSGYITDIICGIKIRISPLSFYQVNRTMAQQLYKKAGELAEPDGKILLDLYCGAGAIGLSMADRAKEVIGVEIIPQAVLDAEFNASQNGIENARFICADASDAAKQLYDEGIKPDVVILDPPRKGCSQEVIETVACGFSPQRVVYISCDPTTLARDCERFAALGYKTLSATPADLFPRTAHVETVALLSRKIDVHKMKLNSAPFEMIKSGEKTIELRLFDEKRQQLKVGDKIVFTDTTTGETLNTTVVKLHRFNTFNELYKSLPLLKCGYTTENIDKATPTDMGQYYSVEEQEKYGVVGIELCRPKEITDECVALLQKENNK